MKNCPGFEVSPISNNVLKFLNINHYRERELGNGNCGVTKESLCHIP